MEGLRAIANREITKITFEGVPDRPGIAADIFGALGRQGANVEMVVSTGSGHKGTADISLAIARSQEAGILEALERLRRESGAHAGRNSTVALVSLLGHDLQTEPGIAGRMFGALSRAGVNIEAISTSLSSVTCMIEEERCDAALAALRQEFNLG